MPGPPAAQLAIALGYFQHGVLGATAVGLAFTFAVLWRFKIPEPIVVAVAAVVGLIVWPLVRSG